MERTPQMKSKAADFARQSRIRNGITTGLVIDVDTLAYWMEQSEAVTATLVLQYGSATVKIIKQKGVENADSL